LLRLCFYCAVLGQFLAKGGEVAKAINVSDGGGGGGGQIAIHYESSRFSGAFKSHGGFSRTQPGGPGQVFLAKNRTYRTLIIDNNGYRTDQLFISDYRDISNDGGRAWIFLEYLKEFTVEHMILKGGGMILEWILGSFKRVTLYS
jgi:hypothetical protein